MDPWPPAGIPTLWRALEVACLSQPRLSLTELRTLVAVAQEEGLSVASVAHVCGFTAATASRTLRGLAPRDMPGALSPCRGLVHLMRGPAEERSRFAFLTPAGKDLCSKMALALRE